MHSDALQSLCQSDLSQLLAVIKCAPPDLFHAGRQSNTFYVGVHEAAEIYDSDAFWYHKHFLSLYFTEMFSDHIWSQNALWTVVCRTGENNIG